MSITPCTPGARELLKDAKVYAQGRGSKTLTADHILLTMLRRSTGLGIDTLRHAGVNLQLLQQALEKNLDLGEEPAGELQPVWNYSTENDQVLQNAAVIAGEFKHHWVGTEHILLAIIQDESTASSRLLRHFGVTYATATQKVAEVIDGLPGKEPGQQTGEQAADSNRTPYTPGMREVIKLSKAEAGRLGQDYIGPEHYLLAMIRRRDGLAVEALHRLEVDLEELKLALEQLLQASKGPNINLFAPNAEAKKVLETTKDIAKNMQYSWLGTEHLLLAIVTERDSASSRLLADFGVTFDKAHNAVVEAIEASATQSPGGQK